MKLKKIIYILLTALVLTGGTCVGFDEELRDDIAGQMGDLFDNVWGEARWDQSKWGD